MYDFDQELAAPHSTGDSSYVSSHFDDKRGGHDDAIMDFWQHTLARSKRRSKPPRSVHTDLSNERLAVDLHEGKMAVDEAYAALDRHRYTFRVQKETHENRRALGWRQQHWSPHWSGSVFDGAYLREAMCLTGKVRACKEAANDLIDRAQRQHLGLDRIRHPDSTARSVATPVMSSMRDEKRRPGRGLRTG